MNTRSALLGLLLFPAALAGKTGPRADIRADINRDGTIDLTGDTDVTGKQEWTECRGAVFLPNIGDTDRRCSKKALSGPPLSNEELDKCNDASDNIQRASDLMAPVWTVPILGLPGDAQGFVSVVQKRARENVRVFRPDGAGWAFVNSTHAFTKKELERGLKLGVDGRDTRRPNGWDGHATLRFSIIGKNLNSTDEVHMRVAPVLTHHHLQSVQQVITVQGNATETPWQKNIPKTSQRPSDIWAQDFMEPGFANMPGPNGTISIRIMIRCPQDSRVAGRQLFEYYRKAGVGAVQHLGGARDEINSGGNIETVPPHNAHGKLWPAGRVILGTHGKQKHHILPYLQAQETQDPILLDTDWLAIGHVDEFLQFLPADNDRGWLVVVDDPRAGIQLLKDLQQAGHGNIPSISRINDTQSAPIICEKSFGCDAIPVTPSTITQALDDTELLQINHECAKRIDANIETLKKEVGLTDKDFIHIPSLFKRSELFGDDTQSRKVDAFFPGVINNLVLTGFNTSIGPNPWGPSINGTDVFAAAIRRKYADIGIDLVFIDDWNSHHNYGGEIHCGSNSVRDMSQAWWRNQDG
ncbi:protein-arginine deiminase domain-containing protein [Aspergillus melleus]|uniref:protein-arginine deiminase domain-containing protein n=1 Tax=Aspergillus melleus TaxID=138277 RepID=UPI001E8DDED8|nr:uncharacterized protein LDX57_004842 [Aspergillus melleus]KAH8427125.1 hypothetical protein LDX57_004842 [Aspergillus melleus]